jgi:hypothetical protein
MRTAIRAGLLVGCLALIPATASAQKVSVDYDKSVDFSTYRTYAWRALGASPNPLMDKRILNAIDAQLAAKGWTKVEAEPVAIVIYRAGVDVRRQLNEWRSGPRWSGIGTVSVEEIHTGQLAVDIYDASTRQLLWRGLASDTMADNPEKNETRLNDAVAKLFKQFPPR